MDRKILFSLMVFTFIVLFLYVVYLVLSSFLVAIAWALFIGLSAYPVHRRLRSRLGGRDGTAAFLMTLLVVLLFVLPLVGLGYLLVEEISTAYAFFQQLTADGRTGFFDAVTHHPSIAPLLARIQPLLGRLNIDLQGTLLPAVNRGFSFLLGYSTDVVRNSFAFILKVVIMVIVLFFVFRDGEGLQRKFWSFIPLDEKRKELLQGTITRVQYAVLYGVVLTCLVQGVCGGFGFWISGLPSPVLFGVMMMICALIPVVGTALIWVPGGIALLLRGETGWGIFLLLWGVVVIGAIDNLIRPLFISGRGNIHILISVLGGLGGLASFGFIGIVAGPLLLALAVDLLDIYCSEILPCPETPPGD
jgi:predicted PurR-regulated permease PerM